MPEPSGRRGVLGASWRTPALITGTGGLIALSACLQTMPSTEPALGWVLAAIAAWTTGLIVIVSRNPQRQLRISDPGVLMFIWAAYYFLLPALNWLSGASFPMSDATLSLTAELIIDAQQQHVIFLAVLVSIYVTMVPHLAIKPLTDPQIATLPRARGWIIVGLIPVAIELGVRLVNTGSIRPETSYLDAMRDVQASLENSHASGGVEFIVTQILTKLRFYGSMVLAVGLALYLMPAWRARSRRKIVLFHAAFPILLYFSVGERSTAAFPFIIALLLTDLLIEPISWRYLLGAILAGFVFFYVYGSFRLHQEQDLATAIAEVASDITDWQESSLAEAENAFMLLKEAYAIETVDQAGPNGIGADLFDALTVPIPQQITGEKRPTVSERLARGMLGDDLFESGFALAGSTVAEGYLAGGALGVAVVAAIVGLLVGGATRLLAGLKSNGCAPLWRFILLATLASQTVFCVRSELGILVTFFLYYIVAPALVVPLLLRRLPARIRSCWEMPIRQIRRFSV